jgi:molybdenum cofactor cytidylyltransferase
LIVNTKEKGTPPVAAIVLAAGRAARMGQLKQLLPVAGEPMVRRVVGAVCAAGLAQVVVVVGAHARAVTGALEGLAVDVAYNERWREGMSSSLHAGLAALRPEVGAALIVLADQPGLTPDLLHKLVDHYRTTQALIVAPFYGGRRGNPVLFDRALFAELGDVVGDRGGRELLARYRERLARLEVKDPAVLLDVDTHQDYQNLDAG